MGWFGEAESAGPSQKSGAMLCVGLVGLVTFFSGLLDYVVWA